jgi:hypothetical protein
MEVPMFLFRACAGGTTLRPEPEPFEPEHDAPLLGGVGDALADDAEIDEMGSYFRAGWYRWSCDEEEEL